MAKRLWVLFVMNEKNAEPIPAVVRPFTRFEMRRMEEHVNELERLGLPARFDPIREEVIASWTGR